MVDTETHQWAKLSELKVGDLIQVTGMVCAEDNSIHKVRGGSTPGTLFFKCSDGCHYLDGQILEEDGDSLAGVINPKSSQ